MMNMLSQLMMNMLSQLQNDIAGYSLGNTKSRCNCGCLHLVMLIEKNHLKKTRAITQDPVICTIDSF